MRSLLQALILFGLAISLAAGSVQARTGLDEPPDNRDEVAVLLDDLADLVRKSGRDDPGDRQAVSLVQRLGGEYKTSGPKDRAAIIRGLGRVFLAKRKTAKDGSRTTTLYIQAARGLGSMGEKATQPLLKWTDSYRHKRDLALQRELILALGRTKSKEAREELRDLLKDVRPTFKAAAASALGMFTHEPSRVRKDLFEDLLKALLQAQSNAIGQSSTAQAIWKKLKGPATASMRKLSGTTQERPEDWQHWWNKNKRRDWDA